MKKFLFSLVILIGSFYFSAASAQAESATSSLPVNEAYKAVVKIKSFLVDQSGFLAGYGEGSGVIIRPEGIILTNYHVVAEKNDYDDTEYEMGYLICIPESSTEEPDCSYIGELISKDKLLDLALLKIKNISGLSQKNIYSYLNLNSADNTSINNEVQAIGYPSIGEGTITITKGIISGKQEKYNKKWIKTDAVVSFGSSGGAAIDKDAYIIGITSASHSDMAGSLGYIISVDSINPWVNINISKASAVNILTERIASFAKTKKSIKTGNKFENIYPSFSITKPDGWRFEYNDENNLRIQNKGDEDSGSLEITIEKTPFFYNQENLAPWLKRELNLIGGLSMFTITKNEDKIIGGLKGKLIIISLGGGKVYQSYVPFREYIMALSYSYGTNEKDKKIINDMISSFKINTKTTFPFSEKKQYSSNNPKFNITANNDWAIMENHNLKESPIKIFNKKIKDAFVSFHIEKTDEETKGFNNDKYLSQIKRIMEEKNKDSSYTDGKTDSIKANAHAKINNKIKDAIKMEYIERKVSTKEVLVYNKEYIIKSGDKYIAINLSVYNKDKKVYNKAVAEFDKLMQNFSLTSKAAEADADKDGLSDKDEVKYGTDSKNPDTDGDGFKDGAEVKAGYNPKGSGKL